jgi:hypothetical protein
MSPADVDHRGRARCETIAFARALIQVVAGGDAFD